MMRIDSHHHFWKYDPAQYDWIDDSMSILRRDFLPEDLKPLLSATGIDGVVSVQARQTLEETQWLLDLAGRHDFIRGVVGWVPLTQADVKRHLEGFSQNRKLLGVRHVVQAEPDDEFILREDFNRGVAALREFGLRYDILIFERHLPATIQFVDRHPQQVFILDHIAKPSIKRGQLEPWRTNIIDLARRPNVYCKMSGIVTEADPSTWTAEALFPFFNIVLDAFGPHRLMFGSDWPVCLLAAGYRQWFDTVCGWTASFSPSDHDRIFGGTATEAYAW